MKAPKPKGDIKKSIKMKKKEMILDLMKDLTETEIADVLSSIDFGYIGYMKKSSMIEVLNENLTDHIENECDIDLEKVSYINEENLYDIVYKYGSDFEAAVSMYLGSDDISLYQALSDWGCIDEDWWESKIEIHRKKEYRDRQINSIIE